MKQIKKLLLILGLILIPLCGMVLADDCFDTVIDKDGKTLYIDPNDKYSVFEDREKLVSIYWNELKIVQIQTIHGFEYDFLCLN